MSGSRQSTHDQPLPEFGDVREEEQLDWPKLSPICASMTCPAADQPLEVKQFHGGHSNLTYLLRFGDA